jgi:hypothetical protein
VPPLLIKINGIDFCSNDEAMQKVAMQFSISSNEILNGCISAIDEWIVKIRRPRVLDGVANPGSFLQRFLWYQRTMHCQQEETHFVQKHIVVALNTIQLHSRTATSTNRWSE